MFFSHLLQLLQVLLALVFIFNFTKFIGFVFISNLETIKLIKSNYLTSTIYSIFGLSFITATFSAIHTTHCLNSLTPILILTILISIYSIYFKKINFNFSLYFISFFSENLLLILTFLIILFWWLPFDANGIYYSNLDFGIYATLSNKLLMTNTETLVYSDLSLNKGKPQLYHYLDLWLNAFLISIFKLNSLLSYLLIVKSLFTSYLLLIFKSILHKFNFTTFWYPFILLFIGSSVFILPNLSKFWYLMFQPICSAINYTGGLSAIVFFALSMGILVQSSTQKNWQLSNFFILLLPCINALFLVVAPLYFILLLLSESTFFILQSKFKIAKIYHSIIGLSISTILTIFYIILYPSATGNNISVFANGIKSIKLISIICCSQTLDSALMNFAWLVGFVYLYTIKCISNRLLLLIVLFGLSVNIFIALFYESIRIDLWQSKIIWAIGSIFIFGVIGLLQFLSTAFKNKSISQFIILLIFGGSVYLSIDNEYYIFGHSTPLCNSVWDHYISYENLSKVKSITDNRGNGLAFATKKQDIKNLFHPIASHITSLAGCSNLIFRDNLTKFDTTNNIQKMCYNNSTLKNKALFYPDDSINLFQHIHNKYQWCYVDEFNTTLPNILRNEFPKKIKLNDFYIYYK